MKFQDLLSNTTTKRNELKPFFNTGETPTQKNFHDLIDGLFLIQGNGLFKDDQNGLSIQISPEDLTKTALLFYDAPDEEPVWTMSTLDGFHLKDAANNARLSVLNDGKVGMGTTTPTDTLSLGINQLNLNPHTDIGTFTGASAIKAAGDLILDFDNNANDTNSVLAITCDNGSKKVFQLDQDGHMKMYGRGRFGYGPTFVDWTTFQNWAGNANAWAGYIGFNAYRNSDDPYDHYYGENIYTSKAVLEGSNAGFRFLFKETTAADADQQHTLSEILRIDKSGSVGIGTSTPADKLTVRNGHMRLENGFLRFENTPSNASGITGYNLIFYRDNTYYNYNTGFGQSSNKDVWFNVHEGSFKFLWANSDRLTINLRSNTSAYYVIDANGKIASSDGTLYSSDERYKKDIETITPDMLTKLEQVRGTTFKWRTDEFEHKNFSEGTKMGFIAQELKEVFPDLVNEGADGYYSINYTGLIPLLVEAVKDLNQKNQALEERVAKLEN